MFIKASIEVCSVLLLIMFFVLMVRFFNSSESWSFAISEEKVRVYEAPIPSMIDIIP